MKIVFFGTPDFAAFILKALHSAGSTIVAIVTRQDKPQGRSSKLVAPAVKQVALQLMPQVPIFQPIKCSTPEMIEELKKVSADLFVVVAYGEILSQALLDVPRLGCINVHGSLLPKWRGAAPIQRALMHGDAETGISIIKMVRKMDAGDVLYTEALSVGPATTYGQLQGQLAHLGAASLLRVLTDFDRGVATATPQDESLVTFADKITAQDCEINWSRSAQEIHNQVRGLSPEPGAFCFVTIQGHNNEQKRRFKILQSELVATSIPSSFEVMCGDGSSLRLLEVQLEGKPVMSAAAFLKGTLRSHIAIGYSGSGV